MDEQTTGPDIGMGCYEFVRWLVVVRYKDQNLCFAKTQTNLMMYTNGPVVDLIADKPLQIGIAACCFIAVQC